LSHERSRGGITFDCAALRKASHPLLSRYASEGLEAVSPVLREAHYRTGDLHQSEGQQTATAVEDVIVFRRNPRWDLEYPGGQRLVAGSNGPELVACVTGTSGVRAISFRQIDRKHRGGHFGRIRKADTAPVLTEV
jgi:hypothetical protein